MSTRWIQAAIFDWIIILIAFSLSYISLWFIPLSMLIIGNRQHALGILGHDGAHQLVYKKSKLLNDLLTNIFTFYPLGICLKEYREFHWDHHRNTNNDKDPEILLKATKPNSMTGPVMLDKVIKHGIMDLLGVGIPHIIAFMWYIRPKTLKNSVPSIILFIFVCILLYYKIYLVPFLWFGALLTTFWFFFRLRVWTEHVGLNEGETLRFTPTLLEKILFLPHNTWLHYEHHEKPSVPFSELPKQRTKKFPLLKDIIR